MFVSEEVCKQVSRLRKNTTFRSSLVSISKTGSSASLKKAELPAAPSPPRGSSPLSPVLTPPLYRCLWELKLLSIPPSGLELCREAVISCCELPGADLQVAAKPSLTGLKLLSSLLSIQSCSNNAVIRCLHNSRLVFKPLE